MRIGIVRDTYFTNEPRGLNIARKLVQEKFEVFVLCYGDRSEIENINGITLHRFYFKNKLRKRLRPLMNTLPIFTSIWKQKITQFIEKYNIDILQIHDLYMLGPGLKANNKFNLPIVANFHENYPAAIKTYNWAKSLKGRILFRPDLWKKLQGLYLHQVKKIIVTCQEYKDSLLAMYDFLQDEDIIVYLNVPDLEEMNSYEIIPEAIDKNKDFILFYFGVNAERRGLFTALDTLKILVQKQLNIKLLLIGPVDKADWLRFDKYLFDPILKDRIVFHKWRNINEIPSYISQSDICLSPLIENEHHNTTIANKLFQYMLFGKPMVISDCKPQIRIINETEAGILHKAGDAKDLANKIIELYNNPSKMKMMGARGRKKVLDEYNTEVQTRAIIDMYKSVQSDLLNSKSGRL